MNEFLFKEGWISECELMKDEWIPVLGWMNSMHWDEWIPRIGMNEFLFKNELILVKGLMNSYKMDKWINVKG